MSKVIDDKRDEKMIVLQWIRNKMNYNICMDWTRRYFDSDIDKSTIGL